MLEILGVNPVTLLSHPQQEARTSYPPQFRDAVNLRNVWARLCLATPNSVSPAEGWNRVLRQFVRWCQAHDLVYVVPGVNRVDNSRIQSYLRLRRRWVTQYLDGTGMLKGVLWNKVTRTVTEDHLGITVNSSLHCRNIDYTGLLQKLQTEKWRPNLQVRVVGYELGYRDWWRWLKVSETGMTRIGFSAAGHERGIFWYNIVVPSHPQVPEGVTVQDHVLNKLWDPVVRELRFRSLSPRISQF